MLILKKDSSFCFLVFLILISWIGDVRGTQSESQVEQQIQGNQISDFIQSPTAVLIDKYIQQYYAAFVPICENLEYFLQPLYQEMKKNIWLSLIFSSGLFLIGLRVIFSLLGSCFKSRKKFVYNREESISFTDVKEHFSKFSKELEKMKKQLDEVKNTGVKTSGVSSSTQQSNINTNEIKNEINQITQNLSKNEETITKFMKEKKHLDNFLFELQKEVVESHKSIWKELYSLRNILTLAKSTTPSSSTPLNKPRTHDRTLSTLQASLDIDKSSPNISSKSVEGFSKADLVREFEPSQAQSNKFKAEKTGKTDSPNYPVSNQSNRSTEESATISDNIDKQNIEDNHDLNAEKNEDQTNKAPDTQAEETNDLKREVSPFRQPLNNGVKQPIKNGPIGRNIPIPSVRRPGPAIGTNPFAKQINSTSGTNSQV